MNPYELCATSINNVSDVRPNTKAVSETLAEMLGDLHFPVELPSNDPGPSPGYPPRLRAQSENAGLIRSRLTERRKRTTSETPPVLHSRPFPTSALSDSLLTVHELPSVHTIPYIHSSPSRSELASHSYGSAVYATDRPPQTVLLPQLHDTSLLPSSRGSASTDAAPSSRRTKRHSAPPPQRSLPNENIAMFSADSTSSWGLDTQPKKPKASGAQEPAVATRMQSQKQMLDLLGSIGD